MITVMEIEETGRRDFYRVLLVDKQPSKDLNDYKNYCNEFLTQITGIVRPRIVT